MTAPMDRSAYEQLVAGDLVVLHSFPRSLERDHVIAVLEHSMRHEYGECDSRRNTLARERDHAEHCWTELANAVVENAPDEFDGDESIDAIAIRYVRHLEAEVARLRTAIEIAHQLQFFEADDHFHAFFACSGCEWTLRSPDRWVMPGVMRNVTGPEAHAAHVREIRDGTVRE